MVFRHTGAQYEPNCLGIKLLKTRDTVSLYRTCREGHLLCCFKREVHLARRVQHFQLMLLYVYWSCLVTRGFRDGVCCRCAMWSPNRDASHPTRMAFPMAFHKSKATNVSTCLVLFVFVQRSIATMIGQTKVEQTRTRVCTGGGADVLLKAASNDIASVMKTGPNDWQRTCYPGSVCLIRLQN